jgi:superfamily II helicase
LSQNILKTTKNFDKHYSEKIIKNHDAIALIKEYYFVYEENYISKYRSMIFKILNKKVDKEIIQQSLSQLKNNKDDVSFGQISEKANRLVTNYNKQT